jgi:hypothetical protein
LFYWCHTGYDSHEWIINYGEMHGSDYTSRYSAFTASELLELLPHVFTIENRNKNIFHMTKHEVYYYGIYSHEYLKRFNNDLFVNLLAKMLIHLIENNFLEKGDKIISIF